MRAFNVVAVCLCAGMVQVVQIACSGGEGTASAEGSGGAGASSSGSAGAIPGAQYVTCGKATTVKIDLPGKSVAELTGLRIFGRATDFQGSVSKWRGPVQYILDDDGGYVTADCPGQQGFGAELMVVGQ